MAAIGIIVGPVAVGARVAAGRRGWRGRFLLLPVTGVAVLGSAVALAIPATAATAPTAASTGTPACGPVWSSAPAAPDAPGGSSELRGLTRTPGGTAWAVGGTNAGGKAIIERLTRSGWVRVPGHVSGDTTLAGVAAVSDRDVWAVGTHGDPSQDTFASPVIDHWNGSHWTVVTGPAVPQGSLDAVAALGPDDIWAVGTRDFERHTLTEHFNGTSWSVVPSPDRSRFGTNMLTGVAGGSAGAVWAVGNSDGGTPTVEYWDGTDWRLVTTPSQSPVPQDIIALSAKDVWAVGGELGAQAAAMNWNGSRWQLPPMPVLEPSGVLNGVAAAGPRDVWAAGFYSSGQQSLAENWNGQAWRVTTTPRLMGSGQINAITALPRGGALAVGFVGHARFQPQGTAWQVCPAQVTRRRFQPAAVTDRNWQTVTWRAATSNHSPLILRDDSGLGLFKSGSLPAGATYWFRFYAAGTYPVAAGRARQTVGVPVNARPAAGQPGSYTLTWAARVAPFGFVYDVRVKAANASQFTAFRTGVSSISAMFTPAAGPGIYQVEARLRKGGARSGWSPPLSITVTG